MKELGYTHERAERLRELSFTEFGNAAGCRLLWAEMLTGENIREQIHLEEHAHSFFEIHLCLSGSAVYQCNGMLLEIRSGKALCLPPLLKHRFVGNGDNLIKLSIAFALDAPINGDPFPCSVFLYDTEPFSIDLTEQIRFILEQSERRDVFSPVLVGGRLLEIVYRVLLAWNAPIRQLPEKGGDPRVAVAKEYIENNKHRMLSREDVAGECCLCAKQMDRIFKASEGCSVFEYVNVVRIRYAKRLLAEGGACIKEIGYRMGFENESSFISFFKRHCGVSPGKYAENFHSRIAKMSKNKDILS